MTTYSDENGFRLNGTVINLVVQNMDLPMAISLLLPQSVGLRAEIRKLDNLCLDSDSIFSYLCDFRLITSFLPVLLSSYEMGLIINVFYRIVVRITCNNSCKGLRLLHAQ